MSCILLQYVQHGASKPNIGARSKRPTIRLANCTSHSRSHGTAATRSMPYIGTMLSALASSAKTVVGPQKMDTTSAKPDPHSIRGGRGLPMLL